MYIRLIALALVLAALFGLGWHYGSGHVQNQWDADTKTRKDEEDKARRQRDADNIAEAAKQADINGQVKRSNANELSQTYAAIDAAGRMSVGAKICSSGPARPTQATGASGSNAPGAGTWLLPEGTNTDLKRFITSCEESAATARAAQSWLKLNGFAP